MGTTYCDWAGNECPNCKLATKGRLRVKHWWEKVLWYEWSTCGLVEKDYWVYEIKCRECSFRWNTLLYNFIFPFDGETDVYVLSQ